MRILRRPRHYVHRRLLAALKPAFTYNYSRDAYVLRYVGRRYGPVLRPERRVRSEPPVGGVDMRERAGVAHRLA